MRGIALTNPDASLSTIYILLPVHDRKMITQRFIKCLDAQTYKNYHLILIDDGSTDGTEAMVRSFIDDSQLTVIQGDGNLWWAGSLQQGANWLDKNTPEEAVVLMIKDDVSFGDDFLATGAEIIRKKSNTLLLAKLVDPETGKVEQSGVCTDLDRLQFEVAKNPEDINCLSTRGLFLRAGDIAKIGGFYPRILPHYWSDYEFTIRAYKKGFSLETNDRLYLKDDETQTGIRSINENNVLEFVRKLFSKRSTLNPIYRTVFIMLACPLRYAPKLIVRTWLQSIYWVFKQIWRQLLLIRGN